MYVVVTVTANGFTSSSEYVGTRFQIITVSKCFDSVTDPGSGAFLTPGSGIGFFRIPDLNPIFLRALGQFLGVKCTVILC